MGLAHNVNKFNDCMILEFKDSEIQGMLDCEFVLYRAYIWGFNHLRMPRSYPPGISESRNTERVEVRGNYDDGISES